MQFVTVQPFGQYALAFGRALKTLLIGAIG